MLQKKFKIISRDSALAMAQAEFVRGLLIQQNPSIEIDIITTKTSGDINTSGPLWQMAGEGFFTKEVDSFLLDGRADFAVHSMKDVGTKRPEGIAQGAICKRDDPRDIVIFSNDISGKIRVGTSSLRRMELLPKILPRILPIKCEIEMVSLRGNINSRLRKLYNGQVDAIAISIAALIRLDGNAEIAELLKNKKFMIMPLTECPPAAAQGAILVECLANNKEGLDLARNINDGKTEFVVKKEREVLLKHGGGCHQRFGVINLQFPNMRGDLLITRGLDENLKDISNIEWSFTPNSSGINNFFDPKSVKTSIEYLNCNIPDSDFYFIAHHNAVNDEIADRIRGKKIYTAGVKTWQKLAERGLWVKGCGDGFGFDFIKHVVDYRFLNPSGQTWTILTNQNSATTNSANNIIATYKLHFIISSNDIEKIRDADAVFWSSYQQFLELRQYTKENVFHACGTGKTAEMIGKSGLKNFCVFPNIDFFRKWILEQS